MLVRAPLLGIFPVPPHPHPHPPHTHPPTRTHHRHRHRHHHYHHLAPLPGKKKDCNDDRARVYNTDRHPATPPLLGLVVLVLALLVRGCHTDWHAAMPPPPPPLVVVVVVLVLVLVLAVLVVLVLVLVLARGCHTDCHAAMPPCWCWCWCWWCWCQERGAVGAPSHAEQPQGQPVRNP